MPDPENFIDFDKNGHSVYQCWQCSGTGAIAGCFEDTCCGLDCDPEDPEYCCAPARCDVCHGKGSYAVDETSPNETEKPETN